MIVITIIYISINIAIIIIFIIFYSKVPGGHTLLNAFTKQATVRALHVVHHTDA